MTKQSFCDMTRPTDAGLKIYLVRPSPLAAAPAFGKGVRYVPFPIEDPMQNIVRTGEFCVAPILAQSQLLSAGFNMDCWTAVNGIMWFCGKIQCISGQIHCQSATVGQKYARDWSIFSGGALQTS